MLSPVRPGRQRVGGDSDYLYHNLVPVPHRDVTASQIVRLAYSHVIVGVLLLSTHHVHDDPVRPRWHGKAICTAEWFPVGYWNRMSYRQLL